MGLHNDNGDGLGREGRYRKDGNVQYGSSDEEPSNTMPMGPTPHLGQSPGVFSSQKALTASGKRAKRINMVKIVLVSLVRVD